MGLRIPALPGLCRDPVTQCVGTCSAISKMQGIIILIPATTQATPYFHPPLLIQICSENAS